jgi:hypothetical protein
MTRRLLGILGTAAVLSAGLALAAPASAGGPGMTLGVAEDSVRSADPLVVRARLMLMRVAGFDAVRVTSTWAPGATAPLPLELRILGNIAAASELTGMRVVLSVYHVGSRTTPTTPEARDQFAAYVASLVGALPAVRDVVIGNEPNLNRFWLPQFGLDGSIASAPAYLDLLARSYDAVKAVDPEVTVWGGALAPRGNDRPGGIRPTVSPTAFIRSLGRAYRASARVAPVMDGLAFHPYAGTSSTPPERSNRGTTTIGLADYPRLVGLLGQAFDGTAQEGSTLPILYSEFGVESQVPAGKTGSYSGSEPPTTRPVPEALQAAYYARAIALAFCQPTVEGILLFHSHDEPGLANWQSGLFYADGAPKASVAFVRDALARARGGSIARCPELALSPQPTAVSFAATRREVTARLRCDLDCAIEARLERLPSRRPVRTRRAWARAGAAAAVVIPRRRLPRGRYVVSLSLSQPVNPGEPTVVRSRTLALG